MMKRTEVRQFEQYGMLTVIGSIGIDRSRHQLVFCRCACGNYCVPRYEDVRRGDKRDRNGQLRKGSHSCGCQSRLAYERFLNRRAAAVAQQTRADIWDAVAGGASYNSVARQFSFNPYVVSRVVQQTKQTILAIETEVKVTGWDWKTDALRRLLKEPVNLAAEWRRPGELTAEELREAKRVLVPIAWRIKRKLGFLRGTRDKRVNYLLNLADWIIEATLNTIESRAARRRTYWQNHHPAAYDIVENSRVL